MSQGSDYASRVPWAWPEGGGCGVGRSACLPPQAQAHLSDFSPHVHHSLALSVAVWHHPHWGQPLDRTLRPPCPAHPTHTSPKTSMFPGRCLLAPGLSFPSCASHGYTLMFLLGRPSRNSPRGILGVAPCPIPEVSTGLTFLLALGSQHPDPQSSLYRSAEFLSLAPQSLCVRPLGCRWNYEAGVLFLGLLEAILLQRAQKMWQLDSYSYCLSTWIKLFLQTATLAFYDSRAFFLP